MHSESHDNNLEPSSDCRIPAYVGQFKPYPVQQTRYFGDGSSSQPCTEVYGNFLDIVNSSSIDAIEAVIAKDASVVCQKGFNGLLPLHRACLRGDITVVRLLLKYGADPNGMNDFDETPLHYACKRASLAIMHLLLEHGADLRAEDRAGKGALHHAAHGGGIIATHYLLEVCGLSPHVRDRNLSTPMHIVCMHGHIEAFNYFLKNERSDLLSRDAQGNTVMHIAASNGNGWMCWRILETIGYQALHELNTEGCTPLDLAKRGTLPQYASVVSQLSFYMRRSHRTSSPRHFVGVTPAWYGLLCLPFVVYAASALLGLCFNNGGPAMLIGVLFLLALRAFHSHRMNHISRMPSPAHAGLFASGMLYTLLCYYMIILPYTFIDLGVFFVAVSIMLTPIMLVLYWKLLTVDPGLCKHPRQKLESGQVFTVKDIAMGFARPDSFCFVCEMIAPLWSTHCKLCEHCYSLVDHHCLYLYRCIAANNHRLFVIFNIVVMASMAMFEYSCVAYLDSVFPGQSIVDRAVLVDVFWQHPVVWSLFVLNALSLIWGVWLLRVQLSGIANGRVMAYDHAGVRRWLSRRQQLANLVAFFRNTWTPVAMAARDEFSSAYA